MIIEIEDIEDGFKVRFDREGLEAIIASKVIFDDPASWEPILEDMLTDLKATDHE